MAAKILAVVCVQFALFNLLEAQCLNRLPGMFPGCGNILPVPEIPNQVILPNFPEPIVSVPYGFETIVSNPGVTGIPAATIIQDSSVANNLANALQLLVVSNLLSNTLPTAGEIIVPSYGPSLDYGMIAPVVNPCSYGPYNYIY